MRSPLRIRWTSPAAAVIAAALLLAITMGSRSSFGLFVGPLNTATMLGAATIGLALAIGQLAWGASQPFCGMLAQRFGAARVIAVGGVLTALGIALVPLASDSASLIAALALGGAAGAAAGGAPLLMGAVAQRVPVERRAFALGVVSAGSSAGQLVLAPAVALAIAFIGWQGALFALALLALAALPLARTFASRPAEHGRRDEAPRAAPTVRHALRDANYWYVTAGFFVCGFHVTFLTTHMPGVIDLCGLPAGLSGIWLALVGACNIASSLGSGWLMQRVPMKALLGSLYALRAAGVLLFLALPKTPVTLLAFALWMGLTYMGTLPPTTGLIAKLYGARNVATLMGITTAVHQVGSFFGAWLGGLEVERSGSFDLVWYLDVALALAAAAIHVPIRERDPVDAPAPRPQWSAAPQAAG